MAKPPHHLRVGGTPGDDPRSGWPQLLRGPLFGSPCFEKPSRSYPRTAILSGQYCSSVSGTGGRRNKMPPLYCDGGRGQGRSCSVTIKAEIVVRLPDNRQT